MRRDLQTTRPDATMTGRVFCCVEPEAPPDAEDLIEAETEEAEA